MSIVHAQAYVRESHLRVESRLPRRFTAHGLTVEIEAATGRERLVGDLCSIRHEARWTFEASGGRAVVDLVPAGSDLTELIVQLLDESRTRRRVADRRRALLRDYVGALRGAIVEDGCRVHAQDDETAMTRPWRTPA